MALLLMLLHLHIHQLRIHDALKSLSIPKIEVHISNIYKREEFRHKSLISNVVDGVICGLGTNSYKLALKGIKNILDGN